MWILFNVKYLESMKVFVELGVLRSSELRWTTFIDNCDDSNVSRMTLVSP